MIRFEVPGEPVAWERARRSGKRYFMNDRQAAYQRRIAWAAKQAGITEIDGPVALTVEVWRSPPESWSQRKRLASIGAPCAVKPDVDNFAKQVADALEGVAYPNDSRITDVVTRKRYGSTASLIIEVGPAS